MARAYGANAQLLGQFETVYGQDPGGNYIKLPFVTSTLGSEQGLIESDVLGQGRDPAAPIRDVINDDGDIVVPVDLRNFGHWLKLLLDLPTTTGVGPYDHTFLSGADPLPSIGLEVGFPEVPAFFLNLGVRANSMALEFVRSGGANAAMSLIGQGETRNAASQGGIPTEATFARFNQFQGSIKRNGVDLGNITRATLTYTNNVERVENIRSDGLIDGADPTIAACTGAIDARFADTTLLDDATGGAAIELELGYTIDASNLLTFTVHEVYLPKPKQPINGPGGVQASFDWQGAKDPGVGNMLTVLLKNDVASYA